MKITLARHSGFCMGVRNAILRIVREINISKGEIYVYGPLIHNPQTINVLHGRGMRTVNTLDGITGKRIVVRTHGIPVDEIKYLKQCASKVINLTCPRVARVQAIIKKESGRGCHTIITGDRDHAEVTGLMSYASHGVTVISDINEIDSIPPSESYVIVSQTTFDRTLFKKIVDRIAEMYVNTRVYDTICDSTRYRQEDVIKGIMQGNDTLVVVGGKNSANTKRLAQIGRDSNIKTLHVETDDEINENDFSDSQSVLVTAGTSTPGWIINNILEKLYTINFKKSNLLIKAIMSLLQLIVRTNLFSSIAAFFITLIALSYVGIHDNYSFPALSFLYVFSMYSINNYFEKDLLKLSNPYKYDIYAQYGRPLLIISIASMALSIYITSAYSILMTAIVFGAYLLGFIYSTDPFKGLIAKLMPELLRKLYNSKIVACFGWIIITILVPMVGTNISISALVTLSFFVFTVIFLRTALLDLIAFQGDLILGRETLPVLIGARAISMLSIGISMVTILIFTTMTILLHHWIYLILLPAILFYLLLIYLVQRLNYLISLKYELLVDMNLLFIIACYFVIRAAS
ncbi:MAG: 4-hydroxy-3-methylbut-2-enyl diphosphate reductase [Spirochaetes bacterium]|nr:4-hydroxy-3-methylbut-2-enyl diphosphate reductase [Spirochaetota bacterium]